MIAPQPNPAPHRHEPPHPPAAHDSDFTHSPLSPLSSLTPPQLSIVESLAAGADPAALAAAHNLSLAALALWVREPHVRATLDALNDLLALHRAAWRHQVVKDTVESLREVMQHADTLPERRRAATQIIRALHGQSRVREHAERAPDASHGVATTGGFLRAPKAGTASDCPSSEIRNPRFEIASALPSHSTPHTPHLTPLDSLADRILAALESDDPVILNAVRDLRGGAADESEEAARALDEGIQRLIEALPGATVASTPATLEPDAQARPSEPNAQARAPASDAQARSLRATKLYTLTYPEADPAHFLLRLGHNPERDDSWLEAVVPFDTT